MTDKGYVEKELLFEEGLVEGAEPSVITELDWQEGAKTSAANSKFETANSLEQTLETITLDIASVHSWPEHKVTLIKACSLKLAGNISVGPTISVIFTRVCNKKIFVNLCYPTSLNQKKDDLAECVQK